MQDLVKRNLVAALEKKYVSEHCGEVYKKYLCGEYHFTSQRV